MDLKTNIVAKDGQALLGKHFHILNDLTKNTFATTLIKTFVEYLRAMAFAEVVVFYDSTSIAAFPKEPKYDSKVCAKCTLAASPILDLIASNINRELNLEQMERFLSDVRDYWSGKECKDLYDTVRNFSLRKLTTFERKKDNSGNYLFSYSRKDEKEDVPPPPPVKIKNIPVFDLHDDVLAELKFEVILNYVQGEESADVFYTLRDPFFQSKISLEQKNIVEAYLSDAEVEAFWGIGKISQETDVWKYQANGI